MSTFLTVLMAGVLSLPHLIPALVDLEAQIRQLEVFHQAALSEDGDIAACGKKLFFHAFPESFERFQEIYDLKDYNNLYAESKPHLDLLMDLSGVIPIADYAHKIIYLGVGGYWDADAVSFLQKVAQNVVNDHPYQAYQVLRQMNTDEMKSFFRFYFDHPHGKHPFPEVLQQIEQWDQTAFNEIKDVYESME